MRSRYWLNAKIEKQKRDSNPLKPLALLSRLSSGVGQQGSAPHHISLPEMGTTISTCSLHCVRKPGSVHPWAPQGQHTTGMGHLHPNGEERHSCSITLLLPVAFDDSKDHLYLLWVEQFSFIPCPGQARQFTIHKKPQNNNLSKSATALCQIIQIIQKED